jgi:hypothetical protein
MADKAAASGRTLGALTAGGTSDWHGSAASGFRAQVGTAGSAVGLLVDAHRAAAEALTTFAGQLASFQADALGLVAQAQAAQADIASATAQLSAAQRAASEATADYNRLASGSEPVDLTGSARARSAANAAVTSAQAALTSAQGRLDRCRSAATQLHATAGSAAQTCASTLRSASDTAAFLHNVVSVVDSPLFSLGQATLAVPGQLFDKLVEKYQEREQEVTELQAAIRKLGRKITENNNRALQAGSKSARSRIKSTIAEERAKQAELRDSLGEAQQKEASANDAVDNFAEKMPKFLSGPSKVLNYGVGQIPSGLRQARAWAKGLGSGDGASSDAAAGAVAANTVEDAGLASKVLDNTPVVGALITAGVAGYDINHHDYLDAGANVAGFAAGVGVFVALSSNPVGWAIAGSIGASLAVSWGIDHYKTIEHWGDELGHDLGHLAHGAGHLVSSAWHDATSWL